MMNEIKFQCKLHNFSALNFTIIFLIDPKSFDEIYMNESNRFIPFKVRY